MNKPTIFISYSHLDKKWKNRLLPQFTQLEKAGLLQVWDDRQIKTGDDWYGRIREVLERTAFAVCLISANFLSSSFCMDEEIPYLLQKRRKGGLEIVPILIERCAWQAHPWLKRLQMLPRDGKNVAFDYRDFPAEVFAEAAERVFEALQPGYQPPPPPLPPGDPPKKVDISRLPETGSLLFGRREELALLDQAWEENSANIVVFTAWGGVGKSTLVRCWCEAMAEDNYRGARKVFAWSFYSQGEGNTPSSADRFIAEALAWFDDPVPETGSPWRRGLRLAQYLQTTRTLLLLDGMEPLQSHFAIDRGAIKDPALAVLLRELAKENPGLCLISTRLPVTDLQAPRYRDRVVQKDLEQVSTIAGRALLRVKGIPGNDQDLEEAAKRFGNHALAVNLLAAYLTESPDRVIERAANIPALLEIPVGAGRHPRRVLAAFETLLGQGPEREFLLILGLFDRPAEAGAIAALLAAPAISGLTEHLCGMDASGRRTCLARLRGLDLIAPESDYRPGDLDCHPLAREHFGAQLRDTLPQAWEESNLRLYDYYRALPEKELPDTLEEMAPLFAACLHGCRADRHQEVLDEVYYPRIQRDNWLNYCVSKLGGFSSDLASLANFFEALWDRPATGLTKLDQAAVLGWAGYRLRALGQLTEAITPMQAGLQTRLAQQDWKNAPLDAGNLSELFHGLGDLPQAMKYGKLSVTLADQCSDWTRAACSAVLAGVLHQAGHLAEAQSLFQKAEALLQQTHPSTHILYSLVGYQYCDLLLSQGRATEVLERAMTTLEWANRDEGGLHSVGMDYLTLGRTYCQLGDLALAAIHLEKAVDFLRQASTQDLIPRSLLARAALFRQQGEFTHARRDLEEVLEIAEPAGMRLFLTDYHLESFRLLLAEVAAEPHTPALSQRERRRIVAARDHLERARTLASETGYHRRDREVEELEAALARLSA